MLTDLIKRSFDLFCRKNWLRTIYKEVDKYNKINAKLKRQAVIVHALVDRYNELYPNDALKKEKKDD